MMMMIIVYVEWLKKKNKKKKRMFRMQAKNYDIIYITINSRLYNVEDLSILTRGYLSSILLQSRLVYRRTKLIVRNIELARMQTRVYSISTM